jgi:TrmH family RNA methyltransferase
MISASKLKLIKALAVKKYRQKYNKFVVEGEKSVIELLHQEEIIYDEVFALERWKNKNVHLSRAILDKINIVTEAELKQISQLTTPHEVLATAIIPHTTLPNSLGVREYILYLDGIRDPGNMGTIIRTADWFGIHTVVCSIDSVDVWSHKVVQATMGALYRVQTVECTLGELCTRLPNVPVLGAYMEGSNLFQTTLPAQGILVIGNEGVGIHEDNHTYIAQKIHIPKHPSSGSESLNAGIAAGILMAEVFRG